MNNGFISDSFEEEVSPQLRTEESRLIRIIEALKAVQSSQSWSTLKIELFDRLASTLERDLMQEAQKIGADSNKLNRLSGQLEWAEKYADLSKLENRYKVQLSNVKKQLDGKTE